MLRIDGVSKQFQNVRAVQNVSFEVRSGERIGIVGESGCGKSTLARLMTGLIQPDGGTICYENCDLRRMRGARKREFRRAVQIIFQNPQLAYNPKMRLEQVIREPIQIYRLADSRQEERRLIDGALESAGLTQDILKRYPHEISGGQAQRLALVRILLLKPRLIVADEPTSMLDVSVQAQLLELLDEIARKNRIALALVSHDMDVVRHMCDQAVVMRDGRVCAESNVQTLFCASENEYFQRLFGIGTEEDC